MGGVGGSYQPGVYVPLKALFLVSFILISIEKPGTKIKQTNAHLNFDLKWVNVTLLLHFFENHPYP